MLPPVEGDEEVEGDELLLLPLHSGAVFIIWASVGRTGGCFRTTLMPCSRAAARFCRLLLPIAAEGPKAFWSEKAIESSSQPLPGPEPPPGGGRTRRLTIFGDVILHSLLLYPPRTSRP
jgi:hypothetical protein